VHFQCIRENTFLVGIFPQVEAQMEIVYLRKELVAQYVNGYNVRQLVIILPDLKAS
jgi:hypothetical protein